MEITAKLLQGCMPLTAHRSSWSSSFLSFHKLLDRSLSPTALEFSCSNTIKEEKWSKVYLGLTGWQMNIPGRKSLWANLTWCFIPSKDRFQKTIRSLCCDLTVSQNCLTEFSHKMNMISFFSHHSQRSPLLMTSTPKHPWGCRWIKNSIKVFVSTRLCYIN